mgnify:CR=1 FL=1
MRDPGLLKMLCERFGLEAYLRAFGARPTQAGEFELLCPVCRKEKLVVNLEKRVWHCWKCLRQGPPDSVGRRRTIAGAGDLVALICTLEACPKEQAYSRLVTGGVALDLHRIAGSGLMDRILEATYQPVPIAFPESSKIIIDGTLPYLLQRGISYQDVFDFGLFWCDAGRYAGRLLFPVYEGGVLVYYQGRAMREKLPGERKFLKSLNPPKTPGTAVSDQVLFNLDVARLHPRVALTEGPIDAVHAGRSAVCSFTKRLSPVQVAKLVRAGVKAVDLMWDADAAEDMRAMWPFLSRFFDTRLVFLPEKDPGALPRWYLDQLRAAVGAQPGLPPRLAAV